MRKLSKYRNLLQNLEAIPSIQEQVANIASSVRALNEPLLTKDGDQVQQWWLDQLKAGKLIQLEYPVLPRLRRAANEPITPRLGQHVHARQDSFLDVISSFSRFKPNFESIPMEPTGAAEPSWLNPWIPALDGISLYSFVAEKNPQIYMEIGSGVSTTFVRRAIRDHGLQTKIISIDPFPRAEIDEICDEVVRLPLEQCDLAVFDRLSDGDVLFCDNSHRGFQNSDVTVFFSEVIPRLSGKDILIGVHDIFLPFDYPEDWLGRHYNEQYYMIGSLLGDAWETVLPSFYCTIEPSLNDAIRKIADLSVLADQLHRPAIYWFKQVII
ncbi:MAG TPA: class I SAM-dependent methyltransferase [Novosphingobium sp.]